MDLLQKHPTKWKANRLCWISGRDERSVRHSLESNFANTCIPCLSPVGKIVMINFSVHTHMLPRSDGHILGRYYIYEGGVVGV